MTQAHILGFPRIGAQRELKTALEAHWQGRLDETGLRAVGAQLRREHWQQQREAGLDLVCVGDFAWYDHLHNATALFSAAPTRFGLPRSIDLAGYFALARGTDAQPALAMKKWFDTNYHYLQPEVDESTRFALNRDWLLPEVREALSLGHAVKVVLPGPLTWLWLASAPPAFDKLSLLSLLLNPYFVLLAELNALGVASVQFDEPILALDLPDAWLDAYRSVYRELAPVAPPILLATLFGSVAEHAARLSELPIAGLHLDLVRGPDQLDALLDHWPAQRVLSLGVVDGRNLWRCDLRAALATLRRAAQRHPLDRLWIGSSCSLLHVPHDLRQEQELAPELRNWMAFATQKLDEVATLRRGLIHGDAAIADALNDTDRALDQRRRAATTHCAEVRERCARSGERRAVRASAFAQRAAKQRAALNLPLLPTTTIGSFPQTAPIRAARAAYRQQRIDRAAYEATMQHAIRDAIERQHALGLDVLVHGEAERNDMVEYFGEQLSGFALTAHGWVQSYGSRCVKPPVIYGDVSRPAPMTLQWTRYAQSLTHKPLKGMLTGPITMLCWSFVRDDVPRHEVALQLALALRDEVQDLEQAGIGIIQIDEPAIREGLPLKQADRAAYLDWAVHAFRLTSCGVDDATQIHTHMCYSEFRDILPAIAALDADVITIETSRSRMALLDAFAEFAYPNDIGPGLYDIHSPRLPSPDELHALLRRALDVIPAERLWVNPDCGLKTRAWPETEAALQRMVSIAAQWRRQLSAGEAATAKPVAAGTSSTFD